jgi:hypothetical protein
MEERLQNIELHLGHSVVPDNDSPSAVYQRLRACEDRILELEKVAPCREFLHFLRLKKLAEHQGISQSVDVDAALIAGMEQRKSQTQVENKKRKHGKQETADTKTPKHSGAKKHRSNK